jgi:DNA-binding NarL/FixJ family response regulator
VETNARRPVTVLAVDDQAVFRRTARSLIAATPGFEQVGEAASGPEALELASELRPDLMLVDVRMPGMDGLETARRLSEIDPTAVIVLISLDPVPELPASIESVGARAHLRKQELSTRTLRAVWEAHCSAAPGETHSEV